MKSFFFCRFTCITAGYSHSFTGLQYPICLWDKLSSIIFTYPSTWVILHIWIIFGLNQTLDGYWIFTYSMEKHTVFLLKKLHLLGFNWFRFLFEDILSYFFLTFIYIHGFCFYLFFLIFLFLYLNIYHNFKSHKVLNKSYNCNLLI